MKYTCVRKVRESKFLLQKELAKMADTTEATISRIENGVNPPSLRTIRNIAAALDVSPADLYTTADDPERDRKIEPVALAS
jgi:transcriptional regulator with XRE-family HTH domain